MTLPSSDDSPPTLTPISASEAGHEIAPGTVPALALGIGCRRDVSVAQIEHAVHTALGSRTLADVERVATLDTRSGETALVAFCAHHGLPLVAVPREAIDAMFRADASLERSAAALAHHQVQGVCEPCALVAMPGSTLVVRKQRFDGVTIAIAAIDRRPGDTPT